MKYLPLHQTPSLKSSPPSASMKVQPKILIVAFAGQGNINPALRFANRLIKTGVHVTFCTSHSVIRRFEKESIPYGLTFAPFSDGHDYGKQPTTTLQDFITDFNSNGARAVEEIISSATAAHQPFDHLVYTIVVPWAARIAYSYGINSSVLWCQSATLMDIYYYYFNGYQSIITNNKNNSTSPINLPGLPPLVFSDLPTFILPSNPKEEDFLLPILKDHIDVLKIAPRILVNTFTELELESIRAVEKLDFLPIGPLILEFLDGNDREDDCISWLNSNLKSSVVYVAFGTMVTFTMEQLEEIADGLLEIRRPFLWVIRDIEQLGRLSKIDELKEHGMIVSWCSQMLVLSHESIGCFVTHGGWNSTLETVVCGVPTVVFPQWADQPTNAKMMEDIWRTGVAVRRRKGDGVVEGKEIVRCVEKVIGDEDIKRNAEKWSKLAREALSDGGSSTINIQAFLDHI